ncbi:Esterase AAEL000016, partial [Durusdinium trenchii]
MFRAPSVLLRRLLRMAAEAEQSGAALRYGDGTAFLDATAAAIPTKHVAGDAEGLGVGDSRLLSSFLSEEEADRCFQRLLPGGEIEYQQWYHMPDRKKPQEALKRLQRTKVAMADRGDDGLTPWYRFPVNDQQRYGVLPMSPTVKELCAKVNERTGFTFNHAVVLYYADGNECIGFHKDKTLDLDDLAPIVSISLGRPGRPYLLRDDIFKPTMQQEIFLTHGALLQLGPETNSHYYHAVRQTESATGARVSVTFRRVLTYRTEAGEVLGRGAKYPTLNWPLELNGQHRLDDELEAPLAKDESAAPAPVKAKKAVKPGLQPEDVQFLRHCLEEAQVDSFFAQNDLRGAGLAAQELLRQKGRTELSKALGQRIGEAYHKWKSPAKAHEKAPTTATTTTNPATPAATPATPLPGAPAPSCWFLAKFSEWFCRTTAPPVTPQQILTYWFGSEPYKFRGGLWWRGIDPEMPLDGQAGTDARIQQRYGELLRSCRHGLPPSLRSWQQSPEGCCALVLLLDQFPRNAFRGTAEMFHYDALALEMAREALKGDLPWPFETFCYVAMMHSEDVQTVEESCLGLLRLSTKVESNIGARLKSMQVEARHHATVLRQFGRFPHRNELLGRESTAAELRWLHSKKLPSWAMSVRPKFNKPPLPDAAEGPVQLGPERGHVAKCRILVLHSNRQNPQDFKKRTRTAFQPLADIAQLHFVEAPHAYTPMGEAEEQSAHLGVAARNRTWWNSTDDPATMRYVGFDQSLEYLEKVFKEEGPFDGVLGFSQGGCMAGLLAQMQPRGAIQFNFCVVVSGFYCRDVELCKMQLEKPPERHREDLVKAKAGVVQMPSFHIWGLQDQLVEPWRSRILSETFDRPVIATHEADHFSQGRHHWPIAQVSQWLADTGLLRDDVLPETPPELAMTAWARVMKGSGVAHVTLEDVKEVITTHGEKSRDVLQRALALMPWNSKVAQPEAAYWLFAAVASQGDFQGSHNELLKELVNAGGWKALLHLHAILEATESLQGTKLQESIVQLFAQQLHEDLQVVEEWRQSDDHQGMEPSLSLCARAAPRFGGAVRHFALRVAAELHRLRGGDLNEEALRQQQPELSKMYRKVLSDVLALLDEFTDGYQAKLKGDRRQQWRMGGMDINKFEALKASPLSDAVLHPEPMPVEISTKEQLNPLYAFLKSGNAFEPNINDDLVFTKGTITRDKRLDLCKQVIGPQGVDDLLQSISANQNAGLVKHLLLGNNVCGDDLPKRIAELLRNRQVALRTWYIAGNRITSEGLAPLCEVLAGGAFLLRSPGSIDSPPLAPDDTLVEQLWLKRNPLHASGAGLLSSMLRTNRSLKVLDLVNCGLMDQGVEQLLPGLAESSLQHLYLDGNGLTAAVAKEVTLAGKNLFTLSLGMNRLFDEGAQAVCEHLSPSVQRLCMASCGMGISGASAVAKLLTGNRTLRFLDWGLLKATSALGEVPNRITDEGATLIGKSLEVNSTLNALLLVHNTIHQAGLKAIQTSISQNSSMVKLELEQLGIAYNELTREEIRHTLNKNRRKLQEDPEEWARVEEALDPVHLEEPGRNRHY